MGSHGYPHLKINVSRIRGYRSQNKLNFYKCQNVNCNNFQSSYSFKGRKYCVNCSKLVRVKQIKLSHQLTKLDELLLVNKGSNDLNIKGVYR